MTNLQATLKGSKILIENQILYRQYFKKNKNKKTGEQQISDKFFLKLARFIIRSTEQLECYNYFYD